MSRRLHILFLLALSLAVYVGAAGRVAITDDADAGHALAAREILERGDWVVLHINGMRWIEKPPLHYWLVAASYAVFGESAFATRLPLALGVVGLVLMTYLFGRHFFSERSGFYGGLAMATGLGTYLFTRTMIPEALYALQFTAAFYLFLRAWEGSLSPRLGYWGCAALVGLAALTRAVVGFLFPIAIIALFLLAVRGRNAGGEARWLTLPFWSSIAVFLLVAAPWHILASLRVPGFVQFYFFNETFGRALGWRYPADFGSVPVLVWWPLHLLWLFPWSAFLIFALHRRASPVASTMPEPTDPVPHDYGRFAQAHTFVLIWAGFILLFFTLAKRMEYYSFPAWPALALLCGVGLSRAEKLSERWMPRVTAVLAALGVGAAGTLLALVWMARDIPPEQDITRLLELQDESHYRVALSSLSDVTVASFATLRWPALGAAAALLVALVLPWELRRRGRSETATLVMACGMAMFVFAADAAHRMFEPHMSSRPLAKQLRPLLRPDDRVAIYGELYGGSSFAFYLQRKLWIVNGRYNGLEFGSNFPDAPHIFLSDREFPAFWRGPQRVFLLAPQHWRREVLLRLPPDSAYLVAEIGGKAIYSNRPVTPEQPSLAQRAEPARSP